MASAPHEMPSADDERELLSRLRAKVTTASSDLCTRYFNHLVEHLIRFNRTLDEAICFDAATTAIMSFIKAPQKYIEVRGHGLFAYLKMSAAGDLKNLLEAASRNSQVVSLESVELSTDARNSLASDDDPLDSIERKETLQFAEEILVVVRIGLDEHELACLSLLCAGEWKSALYAEAMGIAHLSYSEIEPQVKRMKDMLKARITRERKRHAQPS